jgi:hypothetical protein
MGGKPARHERSQGRNDEVFLVQHRGCWNHPNCGFNHALHWHKTNNVPAKAQGLGY